MRQCQRRRGGGVELGQVAADGGLGERVSVVLEDRSFRVGEGVEVRPDVRENRGGKILRVGRRDVDLEALDGAPDAPIGSFELCGDKTADQPALAQRERLIAADREVAFESPEESAVRLKIEDRAPVGAKDRRVALPNGLEAEVVVVASVRQTQSLDQPVALGSLWRASADQVFGAKSNRQRIEDRRKAGGGGDGSGERITR